MHTEINFAVKFIVSKIKEHSSLLNEELLEKFESRLNQLLKEKYESHWYEEKPMKGSAFRCINISVEDNSVDSVLRKTAEEVGLNSQNLLDIFSNGLALWVDPNDVSCRLGKGAIFPVYKKIAERKSKPLNSNAPEFNTKQRPRSTSPQTTNNNKDFHIKTRSLTPPGFCSTDASATTFESASMASSYSSGQGTGIHKLWDSIPNETYPVTCSSYSASHLNQSSSKTAPVSSLYLNDSDTVSTAQSLFIDQSYPAVSYNQSDSSYSFNQYSSYYSASYWKKNIRPSFNQLMTYQHDDQAYQRYHWSRNNKIVGNMSSVFSTGQAQEVF